MENKKQFFSAAQNGRLETLKTLLAEGVDVNAQEGNFKMTALMHSANRGHLACLKYLYRAGAAIDMVTASGDTALSWSASNGHLPCLKYLVQQGAYIDVENNDGETPLIKSVLECRSLDDIPKYLPCIRYLIKKGAFVDGHDNYLERFKADF